MSEGILLMAQHLNNFTDEEFDAIYPPHIRALARKHWTPVAVAKTAAQFLVRKRGHRVLDIGSGAGKFCVVGASCTRGDFTGVEQRLELVELSQSISTTHQLDNVTFLQANINTIDFSKYEAFYLYNSFFENIDTRNSIDDVVDLQTQHYNDYSTYTFDQLSRLPSGVRVATYFTDPAIIPSEFSLMNVLYNGNLKLWEKIH